MDRAGAESMIMNLYRAIDRQSIQFDFIVFSTDKGDFDDEICSLGGKIYLLSGDNSFARMIALKNFLKEHPEYRIVHGHMLLNNAFHMLAAGLARVPFRISHSHSTGTESKGKIIDVAYKKIARLIINKLSTHFIGCGKAAADFLFPNNGRVQLLPNSIDVNHFYETGRSKDQFWLDEFGLDDSILRIIQVGRFMTVKNHQFSVKIAKALKKNKIRFKMMMVGNGELYEDVKTEIDNCQLNSEIILVGVRNDISSLMAGADVMIMPSLHEGFPVVLVESQSVGLPSVIADTISREVDLDLGLVEFASLDVKPEKWVDLLCSVKNDNRKLTVDGMKVIKRKGFDIHSNALSLMNLYKSMN
ncbi:glycosyltransferase [Carboxylicivirga marina]